MAALMFADGSSYEGGPATDTSTVKTYLEQMVAAEELELAVYQQLLDRIL